jgi:hypothetical protein
LPYVVIFDKDGTGVAGFRWLLACRRDHRLAYGATVRHRAQE